MKIIFSRHSKRRIKLYKLNPDIIIKCIEKNKHIDGKNTIVINIKELHYPVKIVYFREEDKITLVTTYPLKKRKI